jgi:hypothetical protein
VGAFYEYAAVVQIGIRHICAHGTIAMADPELVSTLPPVASSPQPHYTIFRGPNGIRAGWRVLIFAAIVFALVLVVSLIIGIFTHGRVGLQVSSITPVSLFLMEMPCCSLPPYRH